MLNDNQTNIFISYSWGKGNGENFAIWLNQFLTEKYSAKVFFDKTTPPGTNLKDFMYKVTKAKYIICICTDEYLMRMSVPYSGVSYEVDKIKAGIDLPVIPIVESSKELPEPFKNLKYIKLDMSNPTNPENIKAYYELLNYIFPDRTNHVSEKYDRQIRKVKSISKIKQSLAFNPNDGGIVTLNLDINDGKVEVGSNKQKFIINWSNSSYDSAYIYNDYIGNYLYVSKKENVFEVTKMPIDLAHNFLSYKRVRRVYKGDSFAFINTSDFILVGQILSIESPNIKFRYKILQR